MDSPAPILQGEASKLCSNKNPQGLIQGHQLGFSKVQVSHSTLLAFGVGSFPTVWGCPALFSSSPHPPKASRALHHQRKLTMLPLLSERHVERLITMSLVENSGKGIGTHIHLICAGFLLKLSSNKC